MQKCDINVEAKVRKVNRLPVTYLGHQKKNNSKSIDINMDIDMEMVDRYIKR